MKYCKNCDISVGGAKRICPICQDLLTGEPTEEMWPATSKSKLKIQTVLYKIQLFAAISIAVVALLFDYMIDIPGGFEMGFPLAVWILVLEIMFSRFLRWLAIPPKFLTLGGFVVGCLLVFTGWYCGFLRLCFTEIIPIVASIMLVINFIFSLTDKNDNAMVYLLCNILVSIVPYLAQFLIMGKGYATTAWTVCMLTGVVTFIGIAVFRGHKMLSEIQKRMHI